MTRHGGAMRHLFSCLDLLCVEVRRALSIEDPAVLPKRHGIARTYFCSWLRDEVPVEPTRTDRAVVVAGGSLPAAREPARYRAVLFSSTAS